MEIETEIILERQIILIHPESSLKNKEQFKLELEQVKTKQCHLVIIDLLDVEWVSSNEIGVLLMGFKMLRWGY